MESETWNQAPETGKNVPVFVETMHVDVSKRELKFRSERLLEEHIYRKFEAKFRPSAFFFVIHWNHCRNISNANHLQEIVNACFFTLVSSMRMFHSNLNSHNEINRCFEQCHVVVCQSFKSIWINSEYFVLRKTRQKSTSKWNYHIRMCMK